VSWFKAVGNWFETRTLTRELADLRAKHQALEQTVAALRAENERLRGEIGQFKRAQPDATKPLRYPRLR
jgi:cell division protein FtsB